MGVWRRNRGFYRAIVKGFFPACNPAMRNKRGLIAPYLKLDSQYSVIQYYNYH